jgi:succinate dehydrogenase flavin-adding protein (antitoxin of CptAB toxin-antitoxin module)
MAQRLEEGRGAAELDRVLDGFLSKNFPEFSASRDGG